MVVFIRYNICYKLLTLNDLYRSIKWVWVTIISLFRMALSVEQIARDHGVTPATVGIIKGKLIVGKFYMYISLIQDTCYTINYYEARDNISLRSERKNYNINVDSPFFKLLWCLDFFYIMLGLTEGELEFLSEQRSDAVKTSRRDLAYVLSQVGSLSTTLKKISIWHTWQ